MLPGGWMKTSETGAKKQGSSSELFDLAKTLMPGGVSSPVRAIKPYPFYTERAKGSHIKTVEGTDLIVQRNSDERDDRSKHGLYRSLLSNMVKGVSEGYTITQELIGVGYKATAKENMLELSLGYSHNIVMELPAEIKVETTAERGKNNTIILKSIDKQLIGQVAAKIRSLRKPEPYKGKGIRFLGEEIKKKAGKSASSQ